MKQESGLVRAIGVLESCFKEKFGTPRQPQLVPSSTAKLTVRKEFIPEQSLKGLSEFSHVWLLSWLHLNTNKKFKSTVHPPRLKGGTVGVFASRSPHRPSPIGLSLARLDRVEKDTLFLSQIDLVDGTPILDVKPYIPSYDLAESPRAGWTERVERAAFEVRFSESALADLARLEKSRAEQTRRLISEVLSQDLRNPRDRSQLAEGKPLEFFIHDLEVRFEVRGGAAFVEGVGRAQPHKKAKRVDAPRSLF
jgi:tRNA-Thr(GGU) m(6)t(6)A37 methyltransferase TsaA